MNHPMTKRAAEYRLGKHYEESTCSTICHNCERPNYFVGHNYDEAVPSEFHCVTCGHLNYKIKKETPTVRFESDYGSWEGQVDRQSGAFTQEEIDRCRDNNW